LSATLFYLLRPGAPGLYISGTIGADTVIIPDRFWRRKLFESKLERFIIKRVFICFVLLSIPNIILLEQRWYVLGGLVAGTAMNVLRFGGSSFLYARLFGVRRETSPGGLGNVPAMIIFIINQFIMLPLLFAAYWINLWAFWGFTAGIFVVPFIIMLNSITEAIGLTKNQFE